MAKNAEEQEVKVAHKTALEMVRLRNNYYRDNYRFLMAAVLALVALCLLMALIIFYLYSARPAPRYFATNILGGLVEIQPLTSPSLSDAQVLGWSARASQALFTLNYQEYQSQLEQTKNTYFTASGGQNFLQAIKESLNLQTVLQGFFVVTADVLQAPTVLEREILSVNGGRTFSWKVKVPLRVTWMSESRTFVHTYNVILTIVRTSPIVDSVARQMNFDSLEGIGIQQFLAEQTS